MLLLRSPAKINLNLKILGKRADGYHQLSSIFQAISLFDDIEFEEAEKDLFLTNDPMLPINECNLVVRALNIFRKHVETKFKWKISLTKRIPIEAGLGGGSSNAATTLFGLNKLHGSPLNTEQMIQIAAELGSDVPFFFSTGTAYVTGRGEEIISLKKPSLGKITLVKPPFGLSTPAVFKNWKATEKVSADDVLKKYLNGKLCFMNDLEKPAFYINPQLKELKNQLQSCGFDQVLMTGSGTCFFCLGRGELPYFSGYKMFFTTPIHREEEQWYLENAETESEENEVI